MNKDFESIYNENYAKIYNYVYYRLLNKETTEDVVGEIFFKALARINSFDEKNASISTWLFKIAQNAVYDHFRKTKKAVYVPIDDIELADKSNVGNDVIARENTQRLYKYLKTLDERMRNVLALRYWGGFSYAEIAKQTNLTEKNVSMILSRATAKLRILFAGEE